MEEDNEIEMASADPVQTDCFTPIPPVSAFRKRKIDHIITGVPFVGREARIKKYIQTTIRNRTFISCYKAWQNAGFPKEVMKDLFKFFACTCAAWGGYHPPHFIPLDNAFSVCKSKQESIQYFLTEFILYTCGKDLDDDWFSDIPDPIENFTFMDLYAYYKPRYSSDNREKR